MSLMNVKSLLSKNGSITVRLTLFYSIATFLLLALVTLFIYFEMENILYRSDKQFLSDQTDTLENMLKNKSLNLQELKQEIQDIPYALNEPGYRYYMRIHDKDNKILMQTTGMQRALTQATFFDDRSFDINKKNHWWRAPTGEHYLLMKSMVKLNAKNIYWVELALDISFQDQELSEYRKKIIITLISGTLFAFFLGYLIAQRGLRRLHELTASVKKITATSLHRRIDPGSWPRELNTLGLAFNQMLDRIETSFSHLTQFSDDLAHELRTPINNLMGETEISLSRVSTVAEMRLVLESNLEELQRIAQMIENLLFLARAENPQLDLKKTLINVHEEIQIICDYYQAIADDKRIKVNFTGKACIRANLVMFRRLLSNLISNALKYTPTEGSVSIAIKESNAETVQIAVRDSGIGIEAKHLPNIFNRFYRADAERSKLSGDGIGLGLAIAKSIVELHQGTIAITSEPQQGTMVLLTFMK